MYCKRLRLAVYGMITLCGEGSLTLIALTLSKIHTGCAYAYDFSETCPNLACPRHFLFYVSSTSFKAIPQVWTHCCGRCKAGNFSHPFNQVPDGMITGNALYILNVLLIPTREENVICEK